MADTDTRWGLFMLVLALSNEWAWRHLDDEGWVNFKVFIVAPATALFMAGKSLSPCVHALSLLNHIAHDWQVKRNIADSIISQINRNARAVKHAERPVTSGSAVSPACLMTTLSPTANPSGFWQWMPGFAGGITRNPQAPFQQIVQSWSRDQARPSLPQVPLDAGIVTRIQDRVPICH